MKILEIIKKHPYTTTLVVSLLYLVIFQTKFVSSGDIWAEAFYEYVYGAIISGSEGFFHTGIAGYFNFLPKLFSFPYVINGLPLQYIDYFFRIIVILFTVSCTSFIAHSYNRPLIKSDLLRSLLALAVLLTFFHISSFSFINIWYVGFIPIILVSLSPNKFANEWYQLLYGGFAMAVCLSKPSVILLPLVVYRIVKHKEILLGALILFAIILQSVLFFTSPYYHYWTAHIDVHTSIFRKAIDTFLYPGLLLLKLLKIYPIHIIVVTLASAVIAALSLFNIKKIGWIKVCLIGLTLLLASYTALYPPDTQPLSVTKALDTLYVDEMKLQRELMLYFVVLLIIGISLGSVTTLSKKRVFRKRIYIASVAVLVLILGVSYRPIDTESSRVYVSIDSFRASLKKREVVCMPIPPTPSWTPADYKGDPTYGWYYENKGLGTCTKSNYDKAIAFNSFSTPLRSGLDVSIKPNAENESIKTLLIPIANPNPKRAAILELRNEKTKKTYESHVYSKSIDDRITYVSFNLSSEPYQQEYTYKLYEKGVSGSKLSTGTFKEGGTALFTYFIKTD